jgi:hypothetical protein
MLRIRHGQTVRQTYRLGHRQSHVLTHKPGRQGRSSSHMPKGFSHAASKLPPFNAASSFSLTGPPNPEWKYGEGYEASAGADEWAKGEEGGWKSIDTGSIPPRYVAKRTCRRDFHQFFQRIISSNDQRYHSKTGSFCILSICLRRTQPGAI